MSKQIQKERATSKKKNKRLDILLLESINYKIILIGLAVIIAGYFALSAMPWDNPIALNVAPVLLVVGYCVIIPLGILYRRKKPAGDSIEQAAEHSQVS